MFYVGAILPWDVLYYSEYGAEVKGKKLAVGEFGVKLFFKTCSNREQQRKLLEGVSSSAVMRKKLKQPLHDTCCMPD